MNSKLIQMTKVIKFTKIRYAIKVNGVSVKDYDNEK